jgi:CubicO group peptidase (beta-lactamase class C family)
MMMQRAFHVILITAMLFISHNSAFAGMDMAQLTPQQTDSLIKYLHGFPIHTQLSVAIIQGNNILYTGILIEKDTFQIIENMDSIFEIGSITKVFTSVLLADCVNKGIVNLSDPINLFFDFPLKQSSIDGKEITLENLANHTSGLPRIDVSMNTGRYNKDDPYKDYDEKRLNDYLQNKMKLDTIPGTKFSYSNLGGGLLGFILCHKAHKTYEALLQEIIFGPLGMKSTTTDISVVKDRLVKGHSKDGNITDNWTFTDAAAGAGAIKSCVTDMVRFIQANFVQNKMLDLPRVKTFSINAGMGVGLGWMIKNKNNNTTLYWHNGGTGGYKSCMAIDVNKKRGVVILSNVSSFHILNADIDKLCFALLDSIN